MSNNSKNIAQSSVLRTDSNFSYDSEHVIESGGARLFNWSEIWQYRELFYYFTWRDIKIKYKQAVLGFLWAILQPLIMMLIFTIFFGRVLNIPSAQLPYPVFVFSGLLLWNTFSTGLTNAANSMVNNAAIIKKIYFPRLVIPVSSILGALFDFFMSLILFAGLLVYYRQPVDLNAVWAWPVAVMICLIATLGPGSWLAALNVKYRDFRYVIPFVIQLLFFLSPVIYPVAILDEAWQRTAMAVSPMYAAIELFRLPLTNQTLDSLSMSISIGSAFFLLFVGLIYFRKTEDFFSDLA